MQVIKKLLRGIIWDWKRIFYDPEFDFSARPNIDYWHDRGCLRGSKLNSFQLERMLLFQSYFHNEDSIFDVGSGTGETLVWLSKRGYDVTASDFNSSLQHYYEDIGINYINLDASRLSDYFQGRERPDYITFFEVLEHIEVPENNILDAIKIAKKGVIFSIPNSTHYSYILRMLIRGRFLCQWRVHPREHVRFWGVNDVKPWLEELLSGRQFELNVLPYQRSFILGHFVPHLFARGIFVVIKKPE
ncbi:class I SAM-dependent methyltransferase [Roseobacter sp. HKCCA0882]|uniref:class I SAM-dependent methyltransferase n=1 Tax=Roseobacter sp. HKCCA0882 TaxID=3120337 RepID=UPI0030EC20B0